MKDLYAFYIDNIHITDQNGKKIRFRTDTTGGDFFGLMIVNMLITVFTFGLGYAWVVTRTMKFFLQRMIIVGEVDLDQISQTEENYKDATGEDMSDMLDIGINI